MRAGARMFKAVTLLKSSSLPVKLVTSTLGYNNEGNFCRDFRKVFGMSALRYRLDNLSNGHQISLDRFSVSAD